MKKLKGLNAYAGIGGNRLLWKNVQITAVEKNEAVAALYKKLFPEDEVIVADAHDYILKNFRQFNFIWTSTPCQTHSRLNTTRPDLLRYPSMELYQQILLLKQFCNVPWVSENVVPYYDPLIPPPSNNWKHYLWSNISIPPFQYNPFPTGKKGLGFDTNESIKAMIRWLGLPITLKDLQGLDMRPVQVIRNCVHPKVGLHILNRIKAV